ncbi:unnamed protein product [Rotaria socialis]
MNQKLCTIVIITKIATYYNHTADNDNDKTDKRKIQSSIVIMDFEFYQNSIVTAKQKWHTLNASGDY